MNGPLPPDYVSPFDTRPVAAEFCAYDNQYYWAKYRRQFTDPECTDRAWAFSQMLHYVTMDAPRDAPKPVLVPWHAWMPGWLFILTMALPVAFIRLARKLRSRP